ncbi:hypothetical protein [Patulibacter defluvii]|uniref:hypothetical protein n=1 Tax=Patulibacter defluvii TaxID=3095358 RepID=UPI002A74AB84|nr:hypothetical protein [Patulibacter sp. DM4]
MTLPLAHVGHWYHIVLYLAPVLIVAVGLWVAGKRMPDEDDLEGFDDGLEDPLDGPAGEPSR